MEINQIYNLHCLDGLKQIKPESINCCVTSPPYYGLRDYELPEINWNGISYKPMAGTNEITIPEWTGCLGLEPNIELYIGHIVQVFREVRKILKKDGTLWLNLGDTYCTTAPNTKTTPLHIKGLSKESSGSRARFRPKNPDGLKPKDLIGIPWRVAFALQADGWYLRMDNIWSKPNCIPESVKDRPTKSHEYLFLLSKSQKYYYDYEAIKEPCVNNDLNLSKKSGNKKRKFGEERGRIEQHLAGSIPWEGNNRNKRSVWEIATKSCKGAHFATFPEKLIEPCILAGCPIGGIVIDPFIGSGTVGVKCLELQRNYIGFDLNDDYIKFANERINGTQIRFV